MKQITLEPREHKDSLFEMENTFKIRALCRLQFAHPSEFAGNDLTRRHPPSGKRKGPLALFNDIEAAHAAAIKAVKTFWEVEGEFIDVPEDKLAAWYFKHYRLCRQVAGFHQLIELLEQGMGAFWAAAEDKVLIFQGNRSVSPRLLSDLGH